MKQLVLPVAIALLVSACATSHAPKVEHTHAHHAHDHAHAPHWGYAGSELPPEHWGDIEVNKLCSAGVEQSPININQVTKPTANSQGNFELVSNYQATDFEVVNNGHTIVFNAKSPNNILTINGKAHKLLQFHYHVPSEHTVMNAFYPLEIHFVHQNADGGLAVVGVLVQKGRSNGELGKILTNLPASEAANTTLHAFNVETLMPQGSKTYAYNGSLTTPPCSEKVQWLLKGTPINASGEQLTVLSKLYNGNNRPVQPQGSRTVYVVE